MSTACLCWVREAEVQAALMAGECESFFSGAFYEGAQLAGRTETKTRIYETDLGRRAGGPEDLDVAATLIYLDT